MDGTKRWAWLATLLTLTLTALGLAAGLGRAALAQAPVESVVIHLPLSLKGVGRADLPAAPTLAATPVPSLPPATSPPSATPAPSATPTQPPTPTPVPSPTLPAETGRIQGRITSDGVPMAIGFGSPGTPQIELRRRMGAAGPWELVANAETIDEQGRFVFENPPALPEGAVYQVWWDNPPQLGADLWMGRWWSRDISAFGDGTDVDLGSFEVADLKLEKPCHDCAQTGEIEFGWQARKHPSEVYRWAVFDNCTQDVAMRAEAWLSPPLGRKTSYLSGPPPGFRFDTRYCWYVRVEDGANGGGWPFYVRKVAWCSSEATCR